MTRRLFAWAAFFLISAIGAAIIGFGYDADRPSFAKLMFLFLLMGFAVSLVLALVSSDR